MLRYLVAAGADAGHKISQLGGRWGKGFGKHHANPGWFWRNSPYNEGVLSRKSDGFRDLTTRSWSKHWIGAGGV